MITMWNFFESVENPKQKRTDDEKVAVEKQYEEKRQRK